MLRSRIENVQVRSPFHFNGVGSWLRIYTKKMLRKICCVSAESNLPDMIVL